jgi:diguanylate cyclase (GGDEF)-like protein/PAS domain S-box-containing protein
MQHPAIPPDELLRLRALHRYAILDTAAEAEFDDITLLASSICDTPIGLITLLDAGRQWFKSKVGIGASETARNISFCGHAILADVIFEVPDASADPRFDDNPLVTGEPNLRFYAGAPLITSDGYRLGALCVIDTVPRTLTDKQRTMLEALSRQVVRQLEARTISHQHRQALDFIQKVAERVPGMIYQYRRRPDGSSCFPYASQGMLAIYGVAPAVVVDDASPVLETIHPDDLAGTIASIDASAAGLTPWRHEYRVRHADGTLHWLFGNALPEREADGAILWHGFITDVTEQKAAALALQGSRQFLHTLIDNLPVGVFSKRVGRSGIDSGGVFEVWNRAAERMSGIRAADAIGRTNDDVFDAQAAQVYGQHDRTLFETKAPVTVPIYPSRLPDGTTRLLRMTTLPLLDANGEVEYSLGIAEDITDLLHRKQELRQRRAELQSVNDASPLGLFNADMNGAVTYVNRSFEMMCGLTEGRSLGFGWRQAIHADDLERVVGGWIAATARQDRFETEFRYLHPDGRIVLVHARAAPVLVDQKATGYVGTIDDITARRAAEIRLAENERRLRMIADNVPALIGYIDAQERLQFCNVQYGTMFGLEIDRIVGKPLDLVFGAELYASMAPHVARALAGQPASFERAVQANGRAVFQQVEYVPDIETSGTVRGFYALVTDVTARRIAERRLADSEHRLRTIADNLPVAITYIDDRQHMRFSNATMHAWTGTTPETVLDRHVREVVGETLYQERRDYYRRALAGERLEFIKQSHGFHQNRTLHATFIPDVAADGHVRGLFTLSSDITAQQEIEAELRRLARFDSLTGLPNRSHLYESLDAAIERAKRSMSPIAVLFLDIDHFKTINDTLGHRKGDLVLQEFAARLAQTVRTTDTVGRLGGDEFVIVLEGLTALVDAEQIADKILAAVRRPWVLHGERLHVTTSVGIAFSTDRRHCASDLIGHADASLYEAKSAGRNAFCARAC